MPFFKYSRLASLLLDHVLGSWLVAHFAALVFFSQWTHSKQTHRYVLKEKANLQIIASHVP